MKISDKDILRTVVELRDEENRQLHVRPLPRSNRPRAIAWFSTVSAAAVAGFFLGFWTNNRLASDIPMTAFVDTIYVTEKTTVASPKPAATSTISTSSNQSTLPVARPLCTSSSARSSRLARIKKVAKQPQTVPTGQTILNDNIRYDLLIKG